MVISGIRIGSPAMTTRGFNEGEFRLVGKIIAKALKNINNDSVLEELKKEVLDITSKYPIYR